MTADVDAPIFLLGMPRSGTTWLSQIFESAPECSVRLSPPYSHEFRGMLDETSDASAWRALLMGALDSADPFMTQNWRRETGELTRFEKEPSAVTHLAVKDTRFHTLYLQAMERLPRAKIVYIVRHPAAALWSWRSCKEFPAGADFELEWRSGTCRKNTGSGEFWGFDDWLSLTRTYMAAAEAAPDRHLVIRYEDLVSNAVRTTSQMFAFSGIGMGAETAAFLELSQSGRDTRPYSVLKGRTAGDSWRETFPRQILWAIERDVAKAGLAEFIQ